MTELQLVATCAFGIESSVRYELTQLGVDARIVAPGNIAFTGDWAVVCRANLWLRTADRVRIIISRFAAPDFDALFETTRALPWEQWIPADGEFPVTGRSRKSQLTSVPAVQRAVKRAVVDRLCAEHGAGQLPETGARFAIEVALVDDQATLSLDTTGPGLHKRGYRTFSSRRALKETLAAALVQLSFWRPERPLIDPYCGTGSIPIEAALIGRRMAPGLNRAFSFQRWPQLDQEQWSQQRRDAAAQALPELPLRILGTDSDGAALQLARQAAQAAGVDRDIHFQQRSFEQLTSRREYGCVITHAPYDERQDTLTEARELHRRIPEVLRKLPSWSHFILTALPDFEALIQKTADRRRKLYSGRMECTYYQFHGPKPGAPVDAARDSEAHTPQEPADDQGVGEPVPDDVRSAAHAGPAPRRAFGGLDAKAREQAELFRARLVKRARHLRRWPDKREIYCYRLYERDIPEIPLVVDRYEDHVHMTEYERPHTRDVAQHAEWLELMQQTAGEALEVEPQQVFLKSKFRQRGSTQHAKAAEEGYEIVVREGGLKFWVNLSDYVDTGLFLDHRTTRGMVRDAALRQRVLNLFAYTGSFSVYAADGAAAAVTTVDWSRTYLDWAQRNLALNKFHGSQYQFVQEDARAYLDQLPGGAQFDLAIVDPPTFSNSKRTELDWQIQRDHVPLLSAVLDHITTGGRVYFSTNFRQFKLSEAELPARTIREISRQTVPEDFRNRRIHRCWILEK